MTVRVGINGFGRIGRYIQHDDSSLTVDGRLIHVTAERNPAALHWSDYGADIVIESTGRFRDRESAALHLKAGTHTVLLSAPGKDVDATIVMGVNDDTYDRHRSELVTNIVRHAAVLSLQLTVFYAAGRDCLAFAVHDRHPYQPPLYGSVSGTGEGALGIVMELVLGLRGAAVVRSDADGKGKSIWITLPL